jgi:Leucine-rich repeat (LRR) protein
MSGSIPTELKALKDLKYLDLSSNSLSGEVPTELSTLTKLGKLL